MGAEVEGADAEPFVRRPPRGPPGHRGRARLVRRGAAAPRGHPGPARRRRRRRPGQGHQPGRHPVAVDAGADLPRHRRRPLPHGLGRHLPAGEAAGRRAEPAGGRRAGPARRRRPGGLRQPERAVGLPADGRGPATSSAPTWPPLTRSAAADRVAGEAVVAGIGAAVAGALPRRHGRRGRRGHDAGPGAAAARARAARPARWCWSATSPTSAGGTARCSPRTRRSARSTTG